MGAELLRSPMKRQLAGRYPPLEDGERATVKRARKRPGGGVSDGGVAEGGRKGAKEVGRHARDVDRQADDDVGARDPQRRGDADDRRAQLAAIVEEGERKRERVGGLSHDERRPESLDQHTVCSLRKRLIVQPGECLRRSEARARAADEESARYAWIRHGSE